MGNNDNCSNAPNTAKESNGTLGAKCAIVDISFQVGNNSDGTDTPICAILTSGDMQKIPNFPLSVFTIQEGLVSSRTDLLFVVWAGATSPAQCPYLSSQVVCQKT